MNKIESQNQAQELPEKPYPRWFIFLVFLASMGAFWWGAETTDRIQEDGGETLFFALAGVCIMPTAVMCWHDAFLRRNYERAVRREEAKAKKQISIAAADAPEDRTEQQ